MIKIIIFTFVVLLSVSQAQYYYGGPYGVQAYGRVGYLNPYQARYIAQPQYIAQPRYVAQPQLVSRVPNRYVEDESPKPFSFAYNNADEYGTQNAREEVGDGTGAVRGSYSYRDPAGVFRQVQYVADQEGFRAVVDTNEPGVVPHKPADAVYNVHK